MIQLGPITPAEFTLFLLLKTLVLEGRKGANSKLIASAGEGICIVRFLTHALLKDKLFAHLSRFQSLEDFLEFAYRSFNSVNGQMFLAAVVCHLRELTTVDTVAAEVEELCSSLTALEYGLSEGTRAPAVLSHESPLGLASRSFIARLQSLSFSEECALCEALQRFTSLPAGAVAPRSVSDVVSCGGEEDPVRAETLLRWRLDGGEVGDGFTPAPGAPQIALLSLAQHAARTGRVATAQVAVEETTRLAHQRGDAGSVTRALLLLFPLTGDQTASIPRGLPQAGETCLVPLVSYAILLLMDSLASSSRPPQDLGQVWSLLNHSLLGTDLQPVSATGPPKRLLTSAEAARLLIPHRMVAARLATRVGGPWLAALHLRMGAPPGEEEDDEDEDKRKRQQEAAVYGLLAISLSDTLAPLGLSPVETSGEKVRENALTCCLLLIDRAIQLSSSSFSSTSTSSQSSSSHLCSTLSYEMAGERVLLLARLAALKGQRRRALALCRHIISTANPLSKSKDHISSRAAGEATLLLAVLLAHTCAYDSDRYLTLLLARPPHLSSSSLSPPWFRSLSLRARLIRSQLILLRRPGDPVAEREAKEVVATAREEGWPEVETLAQSMSRTRC
jgi:hypothetical protein